MDYDWTSVLSLISRVHSASAEFLQKKLAACGLENFASSHGNILFCLSQNDGLSSGELSKKINRDKSTTTALLKKLEKSGLVKVEKSLTDSRKKIVSLTAAGREYNEKTAGISKEMLEKCWKGFDEGEKKSVTEAIVKMLKNLEHIEEK